MYPDVDQMVQGAQTVLVMAEDSSTTLYSLSSNAITTGYSWSSSAITTGYTWLWWATGELYRIPCVEDNISYPWFVVVLVFVTLCFLLSLAIVWRWRIKSSPPRSTRSSSPRSTRSSPPWNTKPCTEGVSHPIRESYLSTWVRTLVSALPLPQYLKQAGREEIADKSLKNTSIRNQDYRDGRSSVKRTEKSKSASFRSASLQRIRLRSDEDIQDCFCRGSVNRLSQFEPGKINSKLRDIFERRSPPPELLKPPRLRLVSPNQIFRKNISAQET